MPRPDFAASTISSEEFASLRAVRHKQPRRYRVRTRGSRSPTAGGG